MWDRVCDRVSCVCVCVWCVCVCHRVCVTACAQGGGEGGLRMSGQAREMQGIRLSCLVPDAPAFLRRLLQPCLVRDPGLLQEATEPFHLRTKPAGKEEKSL